MFSNDSMPCMKQVEEDILLAFYETSDVSKKFSFFYQLEHRSFLIHSFSTNGLN